MPELPDLQYIVRVLGPRIEGRRITRVQVKEPIVLRTLLAGPDGMPLGFAAALEGRRFESLRRHGPFLEFTLDGLSLVIHCMLSGRLQIADPAAKPLPHLCFSLDLDVGNPAPQAHFLPAPQAHFLPAPQAHFLPAPQAHFLRLSYGDEKRMGKVYVTAPGRTSGIPGFDTQGVDILSDGFTAERFEALIRGRRQQVRVFLMDQAALSAIGNAYADEILFAAGIHPKAACSSLSTEERSRLYQGIRSVMAWGIAEVEKAGEPIEAKVRGHMQVRNRKDMPCPVCGATIRRAGVLGYDSFFCPSCQPPKRAQKIPW